MRSNRYFLFIYIFFGFLSFQISAQNTNEGQIHGNFQMDFQTYQKDTIIGAPVVPEKALMNSYANFIFTKGNFSAGARYESYLNTLQGFDKNYNGLGVPIRYASYTADELEVTVGNYYEQFGSGMIFRTYEDKSLGVDNAMDGIRLKYNLKGVSLKAVTGKQRLFFNKGAGIVRGLDGELAINQLIEKFSESKIQISIGGSYVSKYQPDNDPLYVLPQNVDAYAGRLNINRGKFNLSGEYAYKMNDPSSDNNFIYKEGQALLVNFTYSSKTFGAFLSGKRVDNMSFRSDRTASLNNLTINYLPAITKTHTYGLAAMYPYGTQSNGEIGGQIELFYKFKKETPIGGKYGTNLTANLSRINDIKRLPASDTTAIQQPGRIGYKSDFFDAGKEIFYQDLNIELNKKISDKFALILMYQNLIYNFDVIRGVSGHSTVYADVGIADLTYKISDNHSVRIELQHLSTEQDLKNWAMGLIEYSISPNWFFTIFDQYNYGNEDSKKRIHYVSGSVAYSKNSNRFSIGYGRQREGVMCFGGVCRFYPATSGLIVSVSSSF
jgi:hypothetical protein